MAHEKTAEECRFNEWAGFVSNDPSWEKSGSNGWHEIIKAAFEAGFAAGRRGERIEVAARLMTVVLGQ